MDRLEWKLLAEEPVKKDAYVDLRAEKYLLPNGMTLEPYYRYHSRSFVVIAAKKRDGAFICVRQFRPGVASVTTEFPAGAIEEGEEPLEAARRELREETGYASERWRFLGRICPNATIADNFAWCYLAEDCEKSFDQSLDSSECLEVSVLSPREIAEMLGGNEFVQAVHVAAYFLAEKA